HRPLPSFPTRRSSDLRSIEYLVAVVIKFHIIKSIASGVKKNFVDYKFPWSRFFWQAHSYIIGITDHIALAIFYIVCRDIVNRIRSEEHMSELQSREDL